MRTFTKRLRLKRGRNFFPSWFSTFSINSGPIIEKLCWRSSDKFLKTKGFFVPRRRYSLILAEFDLTDRLPFRFRPWTKSLKIPVGKSSLNDERERWGGGGWVDWGKIGEIKIKNKKGDARYTVLCKHVLFPSFPPSFVPPFFTRALSSYARNRRISPPSPNSLFPAMLFPRYRNRSLGGAWRYVAVEEKSSFRNKPATSVIRHPRILFLRQKFSCPPSQLANKQRSRVFMPQQASIVLLSSPVHYSDRKEKEKRKEKMEEQQMFGAALCTDSTKSIFSI